MKLFAKNPKNTKRKIRKTQSKKSEKHKINLTKNTKIEFQDEEKRDGYLSIAQTSPQFLLENEKPILFFAACRGGWPRTLAIRDQDAKLEIARDYHRQICNKDISAVDNVSRNPEYARLLINSYARNMATTVKKKTIYADVKANQNVSDVTLSSYIEALERLFIIKDIDAWTPQIRSKTAIRSARKHIFVDPSIGLAGLGISPEYFKKDIDYFGHVFENMVLRDLLVFAETHNAKVMH